MTQTIVITSSGVQSRSPDDIRNELISIVSAQVPDYTANLPGSLIEDISSTSVAAITLIDQAKVDLINSVSPYAANEQLLIALGNVYGVKQGSTTNTSVYVTFYGTVGYAIPIGFSVSDGTYNYSVQSGGIIGSSGSSQPLYCVSVQSGTWAVPIGSVTSIASSVPSPYTVTCSNLTAGIPGTTQTIDQFRANVVNAGKVISTGMADMLTTQLLQVTGVESNLISIIQSSSNWEVIVGGGDPYAVAYAIYLGLGGSINTLVGSTLGVTGITNANPGVVTTNKAHGFGANGTVVSGVTITGVSGMSGINGVSLTITVTGTKTFSIGINTTSSGTYTSGGVVSPNSRNFSGQIIDGSNSYYIPYVQPTQQTVAISLTWNTISGYLTASNVSVQLLAAPALANYVNNIQVGQPINVFALQETFVNSISSIIPSNLIDRMIFSVSINGTITAPSSGTGAIYGDSEGYFYCSQTSITVTQG